MRCFREVVRIEIDRGTEVGVAVAEAIRLARERNVIVEFAFNGQVVRVSGDSDAGEVVGSLSVRGSVPSLRRPRTAVTADKL